MLSVAHRDRCERVSEPRFRDAPYPRPREWCAQRDTEGGDRPSFETDPVYRAIAACVAAYGPVGSGAGGRGKAPSRHDAQQT
jgi:hypothetical protein